MLAARDGGCINCASPVEGTEPHHIEWFSRGGPTDIDNLTLLCERCHHLVHDDGWQLHKHNGRLRLQPPSTRRPGRAPRWDHKHNGRLRLQPPPQPSTQRRLQRDTRSQPTGHPRPQRSLILRT